MIKTNSKRLL